MPYRKSYVKFRVRGIKPEKSIFTKLVFWIFVLIFLSLCATFYFVLFFPRIQINDIVISGNQEVKPESIQEIALDIVKKEIFSMAGLNVYTSSIFLLNNRKIAEKISSIFPIVESVVIEKKYPDSILIKITERASAAAFCEGSPSRCFLVDSSGFAYKSADLLDKNTTRITGIDTNFKLGQEVVDKEVMVNILGIKKLLDEEFRISLTAVQIIGKKLVFDTGEGWKMYFDISDDARRDEQLMKISALLGGGISEQERRNLRYVDLRPEGMATICDNTMCAK